jgi:hypothetical protein
MPPRAILDTLQRLCAVLEPLGLPMALMGGLALSAWKHVRATMDVDLLVGVDTVSIQDILDRASASGFRPKHQPAIRNLGSFRIIQLEYEPEDSFVDVQVDLLLADSAYHIEALQRRVRIELPELGSNVYVLTCEDLILFKLLAGRAIDLADVAQLLSANRNEIDFKYLQRWSRSLGVENELENTWTTAFAGESFPA